MPAIGREIGIADFWVAVAYTWSAVLWVLLAPYWAEKSDHHGRKVLTLMGVGGFIVSMTLCGVALCRAYGSISGALTFGLFALFRAIYGALGCATPPRRKPISPPRPGARAGRGAFGVVVLLRPRHHPRPGRRAVVRAAVRRPRGALVCLRADCHPVFCRSWLAAQRSRGRRAGHGAAMSYPSLATTPTGASVVASRRRDGKAVELEGSAHPAMDLAGVVAGHAQAATLTCIGFFVIDRLHLPPSGSEEPIAIVMMAGAVATSARNGA